jgi:hypothetical protein
MQIETTLAYYLTPIKMTVIKMSVTVPKDAEKGEFSCTLGGKQYGVSSKDCLAVPFFRM